VPLSIAKKDIDAAFKRVMLEPTAAGRSATDLPPPETHLPATEVPSPQSTPPPPSGGGRAGRQSKPGGASARGKAARRGPKVFRWLLPILATLASGEKVGGAEGVAKGVTAISLVACFGGSGSPGEFMVWAWGIQAAHAQRRPADPDWHDTVDFSSSFLMDDQVIIEPMLGVRPFMSSRAATEVTLALLGQGATNEDKDAVEGTPTTAKMVWGVLLATTDGEGRHWGTGTASLSSSKLTKNLVIFSDPALDPQNKRLPILTVQVCRGNGEWLAVVQDSVRPELRALDAVLRGAKRGQLHCDPPGTPTQVAETWEEFREVVEFFRVLLSRPELWGTEFTNSFSGMLSIAERLSLPGEREKVLWRRATPRCRG